jgi:hypothetical protein
VAAGVARISPARPRVVPTGVPDEPVLRGAMLAAVDQARASLLASVADPSAPGRLQLRAGRLSVLRGNRPWHALPRPAGHVHNGGVSENPDPDKGPPA